MRKDIKIDTESGDMALRNRPPAYSTTMAWVTEDDEYVYGECELSGDATFDNLPSGVGVKVERKDSTKKVKVRFARSSGHGNKLTTDYLPLKKIATTTELTGARLITVSDDLYFRIYLSDTLTFFWASNGIWRDLSVDKAIDQNEFFLLMANKSSLFNNPLTGVGMQMYLNGEIVTSDLPLKIQSEFELDKMTVNSVKYDRIDHEIIIDSNETDV